MIPLRYCKTCNKPFRKNRNKTKDYIQQYCSLPCYWKNYKNLKPRNWKGGITPLHVSLRTSKEYQLWRQQVFERDWFRCTNCGDKIKKIEAHHIKPFSLLIQEFLKQYNQFSVIEDKQTLLRIAINHKEFWDLSNGRTLCYKCHDLLNNAYIVKDNKLWLTTVLL